MQAPESSSFSSTTGISWPSSSPSFQISPTIYFISCFYLRSQLLAATKYHSDIPLPGKPIESYLPFEALLSWWSSLICPSHRACESQANREKSVIIWQFPLTNRSKHGFVQTVSPDAGDCRPLSLRQAYSSFWRRQYCWYFQGRGPKL